MQENAPKTPSIDFSMKFEDYLAAPGLNATAIKKGDKSMLLMHHELTSPPTQETPSFRLGNIMEQAVLSDDSLDRVHIFDKRKYGKEYEELKEKLGKNRIVNLNEYELMRQAKKIAYSIPQVKLTLDRIRHTQVAMFWELEKIGKCKALLDGWNPQTGEIFEYKTTRNLERFFYQAGDYGYHIQAGWYSLAVQQTAGKDKLSSVSVDLRPVTFIVQENKAPFDCFVSTIQGSELLWCADRALEIAMDYFHCKEKGRYPGIMGDSVTKQYEFIYKLRQELEAWSPED